MADKSRNHPLWIGDDGGSSSGDSKRKRRRIEDAEDEEEDFLEKEMIKKYTVTDGPSGRSYSAHYGNRSADISMFVYRMYLLNHRRSDRYGDNIVHLRNRTVIKPRLKGDILLSGDVDRCFGRMDFGFEPDKTYVLAASRRMIGLNARRSDAQYTFYCDNMSGLISSPHCELMRPSHSNDFVWIKDLNSVSGTYVNGKKIAPMTRYKLVEGDIIGLGIPHNCPDSRVNVKSRRFYILKVKKLGNSRDEDDVAGIGHEVIANGGPYADHMEFALNNVLIVDKIVKYFKLKELKNCRLLNSFWKSRADFQLVEHARLKFEYTYHPRYMTVSEVRWSDAFQEKVALMKKYQIFSFEIDVTNNSSAAPPRQFFSDVQWLVDTLGRSMKDLVLSMSVVNDRKGTAFQKTFSNLVNVESLDLSLDINTSFYPVLGNIELRLPNMKRLALWVHDVEGDDEMRAPLKNHIIAEVARIFPHLQGITVKTGLLQNFLQYLHANREGTIWKGLTEISAEFEMYGEIDDPVVSFSTISTLLQTLTKLQLDDIPPLTDLGVAAFEQMLKKHSSTLKVLCLKFAESGTEDGQRVITFPSFPRLTFLEIIIYVEDDDLHLRLQFPSGQISYEKDFPNLRNLSLLPADSIGDDESDDSPSNVEAILTIFLPEDSSTVSNTLRWVEFSLDKEMTKKNNPKHVWYKDFLLRFQKIFPNVHHPDVIKGLKNVNRNSSR